MVGGRDRCEGVLVAGWSVSWTRRIGVRDVGEQTDDDQPTASLRLDVRQLDEPVSSSHATTHI